MKYKAFLKALKHDPKSIEAGILNRDPDILGAALEHVLRMPLEFLEKFHGPNMTVTVPVPYHKKTVIPEKDWQQLSGFFNVRNPEEGHRRFVKEDSDLVVEEFKSDYQANNHSLPIYVGFLGWCTEKELKAIPVQGIITELDTRHNPVCQECYDLHGKSKCLQHGLFAKIEWFDSGKELLRSGPYGHLEVRWRTEKMNDDETGATWSPTALKDVGLVTNWPMEDCK